MPPLIATRRERWIAYAIIAASMLAALGLMTALSVGAAVLIHPPLFATLRPWWPPLAAIGLLSVVVGYWLLWGRR